MDVADLVARFSAEGDERVIRALGQVDAGVTRVADNSTRAGRGLGTVFQVAGGFLAAQAVTGIFRLADGLVDAQTRAEQAKVSLEVVTGSAEEAAAVFERIQQFAAATPFEMGDLLDATIQLEAFGLKSEDWLTTIGDTASAMGKSVDQVTQAVLDATSGQYERLKELGIQARVEGDKLTFSYMKNGQQITETVDKNNKEIIASTIQGIWNEKYAGAMEKQSKTFGGQMSTLKDNINLAMQSATAGVFQFATKGLAFINDIFADGFVATIRDRFGPGAAEFVGHVASMASGIIDAFGEGTPVKDILDTLPESWRNIAEPVLKAADAFGQLVTNISQGDWDAVLDDLQQLAQAGLDLGTVVIGAAFTLAEDTVSNIWDWFKDEIGVGTVVSGDGTGGPDTDRTISLGEALIDATLALADGIYGAATSLEMWLYGKLTDGWDKLVELGEVTVNATLALKSAATTDDGDGSFVDGIRQDIVDGINASADFATDIASAVWDKIASFDWLPVITVESFGAGSSFGAAIHDAIVAGVKAAISLVEDFSAEDALRIIEAIGAGVVAAATAAPAVVLAISTAIGSFLAGAITGLAFGDDVDFGSVWTKIRDGIVAAVEAKVAEATEIATSVVSAIGVAFSDPALFTDVAGEIAGALWDAVARAIISHAPTTFGLRERIAEILGYDIGPSGEAIDPAKVGQFADIDLVALTSAASALDGIDLGPRIADFESLATKGTDLGTAITDAASQIQSATNAMSAGFQQMTARAQAAMTAMRAAAEAQFAAVVSGAQRMASGVVGAVAALPSQLFGLGLSAGQSLALGLQSQIGAVQAAANAIAAAVDVAVRARLQIASPSKVMRGLGEATAEGFLLPLRAMEREAAGLLGVPGLSPARVAAASGAGGTVVIDNRGAFIGPGAVNEMRRMIADAGATVIDRRLGSAQLAGARR